MLNKSFKHDMSVVILPIYSDISLSDEVGVNQMIAILRVFKAGVISPNRQL